MVWALRKRRRGDRESTATLGYIASSVPVWAVKTLSQTTAKTLDLYLGAETAEWALAGPLGL